MAPHKMKIRSLEGGTSPQRKKTLLALLKDTLRVRFSKLTEAGDSFVVVCLSDDDVNKLIKSANFEKFREKQFKPVIPPHLRALRSLFLRDVDPEIMEYTEEDIFHEIQRENQWAKVEEVKKFGLLLKVQLADIDMADRALKEGLVMFSRHTNPATIEKEDYVDLTPCWKCYAYDHPVKSCPKPADYKICSECSSKEHIYRECRNEHRQCVNCGQQHRTLASVCQVRRELIRKTREARKAQTQSQTTNNSYANAVRGGTAEAPQGHGNRTNNGTILQLNSGNHMKIITILIHAHLINLARPGSFGRTVSELLAKNGLQDVALPDDVPSAEVFSVRMGEGIPPVETVTTTAAETTTITAGASTDATAGENPGTTAPTSTGEDTESQRGTESQQNQQQQQQQQRAAQQQQRQHLQQQQLHTLVHQQRLDSSHTPAQVETDEEDITESDTSQTSVSVGSEADADDEVEDEEEPAANEETAEEPTTQQSLSEAQGTRKTQHPAVTHTSPAVTRTTSKQNSRQEGRQVTFQQGSSTPYTHEKKHNRQTIKKSK